MALKLTTEIKNSRLQVLCDAIDALPAFLNIYNAEKEIVCQLAFPVPCKLSIDGGLLTFNNIAESMVLINAIVTTAEIVDENGDVLVALDVGDMSSNADLKLPSTTLFSGSLLRLNGWTIIEL